MSIEGDTNTQIGAYRLGGVIGRGGMGVVYKATHLHLGREVALKLLAPELSGNEEFRRRFLRESRLAASLDHPNVITVYDAGDADGTLYIAMRYIEGADLARYLSDHGPLDPLAILPLLDQVAAALDAAHEHGLIHRDVKPANVMIASGRCYLTDFGLTKQASASAAGSALTRTGSFLGTLNYTAPEQIEGREITASADLYALGCVFQECLTGAPPFTKDWEVALLYAHLQEPPPPPSSVRPDLPPALDGVIAKALAKLPTERYATCGEFMAAARAAITQQAGATPPAQAPAVPAEPTAAAQPPMPPAEPTVPAQPPMPPAQPTVPAQPPTAATEPATVPAQPTAAAELAEATTRREASPTIVQPGEPGGPGGPGGPGRRGSRRRVVLSAIGVGLLAAAIVGIVIASGGGSSKPSHGSSSGGSSSGSSSGGSAIPGAIRVGNSPDAMVGGHHADQGTLFVASAGAGTVYAINEANGVISSKIEYASHSNPAAPVAYWQGYLWVGDTSAGTVQRIKRESTGQLVKVGNPIQVGGVDPYAMTVAPGGSKNANLWIASFHDPTIAFIKPGTTEAHVISGLGDGPKRMTESTTTLFVANQDNGTVTEVNPFNGQISGTVHVGGNPAALNYQSGILWVVDINQNTVTPFSVGSGTPSLKKAGSAIDVGRGPKRVTASSSGSHHYMWVSNSGDGTVTRIDTDNNQTSQAIKVGGHPDAINATDITAADHVIWVAVWSNSAAPEPGGPAGGPPGGVQQIDQSNLKLSTP